MAGKPTTVRIHGPLQPYAQGFAAHLLKQGYAEGTVMHHMYLLAHASAWLTQRCLDPMELGREQVDEYLRDRRAEGKTRRNSRRGLAPLLQYLRELGAAPEPVAPCTTTPLEKIVEEFTSHMWREWGLAGQTIVYYRRVGVMFLSTLRSAPTLEGLADMTVADMSAFLLDQSRHMGDGALGNVVTGLRALLRFLHLRDPRQWHRQSSVHRDGSATPCPRLWTAAKWQCSSSPLSTRPGMVAVTTPFSYCWFGSGYVAEKSPASRWTM
jgi:integrase/recombinase XerD